jgi:hypothetical protein
MFRKTVLWGALALALLLTGFIFSYQTRPSDRHPGIESVDWIQLSENSGVLLTRKEQFLGLPPNDLHGVFYVKVHNTWHRFYFDPAPSVPRPLAGS